MIQYPEVRKVKKFDMKELHKKIGQILVMDPTDSDIAEGYFMRQVWFVDESKTFYLLSESIPEGK